MKCRTTAIIIIIFLTTANNLFCQGNIIEATKKSVQHSLDVQTQEHYTLQLADNIPASILKVSFWFYKNFFSAQDFGSCSFHPSCSQYAVNAISQKGVFKGYLMTFDRLSRCHSLAPNKYEIHVETGLLFDPVN
ncbi:hypothetical protein GCM10027429_07800 [Marivirga atlantica]|jgi:putative membrane protein insertion efficiency factor|nr:membrane protein insertion efficiency factor YidD [Marivirga atlantica]